MNFLKPANVTNIINVFRDYMRDKYNVEIENDENIRRITQTQMNMVAATAKGIESLQDLNIQVLGHLRKTFLEKLSKPKVHIRDAEVFGNRRIVYNNSMPIDTTVRTGPNADVGKRLETINQQRQSEFQPTPVRPPQIDSQPVEEPENIEDFLAKVKNFERERLQSIAVPPVATSQPPPPMASPIKSVYVFTPTIHPGAGEYILHAFSTKLPLVDFSMIITLKINEERLPMKVQSHIMMGDTIHAIYEPFTSLSTFKQTVDDVANFSIEILGASTPLSKYSLVTLSSKNI